MKAKQVLNHLQITRTTLSRYVRDNKLRVVKLHNGQYDYLEEDVFSLKTNSSPRINITYARVSTHKQKQDLVNQEDALLQFTKINGIIISKTFSEICSGMDLQRKQFQIIMQLVMLHKIDKIFITYKDRLTRINFDFIAKLFSEFGTHIVILNDSIEKPTEQEFFEDLVSMIHSFSMKMYSKRKKKKLNLVAQDLELEVSI